MCLFSQFFDIINSSRQKNKIVNRQTTEEEVMSTYSYEGMEREYTLYRPSNLKENSPLVVFLHWYTGSAKEIIDIIGFNDIADKYGFAVLYPEGLLDKYGNKHWNSGLQLSEVDDIGFITALIKSLQEKYILDKHNTFVTGISNGGFMTYSLALHKPELFNAFAPVIGTMSGKDWNERTFKYPVPILHICGLDDEVVPFDGTGSLEDGWGGAPNINLVVEYWADVNQCDIPIEHHLTENSTLIKYSNGINDNEVWLLKIKKHGHDFPTKGTDIDGGELLWEFFSKYIR
jgi:polyhydroxybutyrate depolymerase